MGYFSTYGAKYPNLDALKQGIKVIYEKADTAFHRTYLILSQQAFFLRSQYLSHWAQMS